MFSTVSAWLLSMPSAGKSSDGGKKTFYSVMLYSNMKHFTVLLSFYVLETFIRYLFDTLCIHCLNTHRKTTQYNFFVFLEPLLCFA